MALLLGFIVFGQTERMPILNYSSLDYLIVDRDTNSITCQRGKYGNSDFYSYDSTYIFAHLIFPTLPMEFNEDSLSIRTKELMLKENIQMAYIWRDTESLWMLPFSYQSEEMREKEQISLVGWIMFTDDIIRY